ncbi:glycosyltransferase family 87 protein [Bryobacter aggregatus]|uniref:glycosyltransferase family 87 protein n=1 Tax=Bryobacter aggregatus TaxID=360054 RepID=UPI0004E22532|nr:glycosyltransferase family 87 protein [Bryobacter aggregatus]
MKAVLNWFPIAAGLIFLLSLAYLQRDRAWRGENDFVQLYTGATLVGTPGLYSRAENLAVVQQVLGLQMESVVYTRPPFYAALLKPLALLPYRAAYAVFSLASIASVIWFVVRFSRECPSLPIFMAMSIPVLTAICGGQDTPFLLAILGASLLLTRSDRDFLAGLVLSLVAIKFHLFLFVPLLLLVKKRWWILGGATTGSLALTGLGICVAGVDSILNYANVLHDPWINFSATMMPNLHGLVTVLQAGPTLEMFLVALVLAAISWMLWSSSNYEFLFAASLVCGLLVSFHSGVADEIILLPVFVSVVKTTSMPSLRVVTALILTPIPSLLVLADAPYSAFFPVMLLLLLGLFCAECATGFKRVLMPSRS